MNQNDLFQRAMLEYGVGEEAAANGWGTIISCVLSEFTAGVEYVPVKTFLRTQEQLFKENGGVVPAAYRSAKSTLLNGIKYGVNINQGKSAVYDATKAAKKALESPPSTFDACMDAVNRGHRMFHSLTVPEQVAMLAHIKGVFSI